ncbi:hypothetical protein N9M66_00630 [Litoreibacter sp.]|nr:hypothetical protein [Litoreibacter sp.]
MSSNAHTTRNSNPEEPVQPPTQNIFDLARAKKAKLLLDLIDKGEIPAQSDAFVGELVQLVRRHGLEEKLDPRDALNSLTDLLNAQSAPARPLHISDHPSQSEHPRMQAQPDETGKDALCAQPDHDASEISLAALVDQHPAVICQRLKELEQDDLKQLLKKLPGTTARQVAFLTWQKS